jgi:purine-binding chemotaxis protein CheW
MSNLPATHSEKRDASSEIIQLVSFELAQEEYGIEVLKVREIIRTVSITHMPNSPAHIEGIINLRGKIIPIVSLRRKFGLEESDSDTRTRIVVMDVNGALMGFIVDSVSEVIRISSSEIQPPPPMVSGGIDREYLTGVINQADRLLILLDLEKLFAQDDNMLMLAV